MTEKGQNWLDKHKEADRLMLRTKLELVDKIQALEKEVKESRVTIIDLNIALQGYNETRGF